MHLDKSSCGLPDEKIDLRVAILLSLQHAKPGHGAADLPARILAENLKFTPDECIRRDGNCYFDSLAFLVHYGEVVSEADELAQYG